MAVRAADPVLEKRVYVAFLVVLVCYCLLIMRLWVLQGVKGSYYKDQSENNRIRTIKIVAPRGAIYDRENRPIVQNRPSFNVALMLEDIADVKQTIRILSEITGRPEEVMRNELKTGTKKKRRHFEPQVVIPDASHEEVAKVKVNAYRLPGVIVDVSPARVYPYGSMAAQALGYIREISQKQLEERVDKGYKPGEMLGQTGLESVWEETLRGSNGYQQVEVDAHGNRKKDVGVVDGVPGKDIFLTLDIDVQLAAEEALKDKKGAVVAIDPQTGEVLVMASAPSYDANVFSGNVAAEDWHRITGDKALPLNNRAISGTYPPGSTFKLIAALAALGEKKIDPTYEYNCPGYFMMGRRYACHKKGGHGAVNMQRALEMSCNVYFYQLGLLLGVDTLHKYASMLGLGSITGVGLPGEEKGVMPSEEWKKKRFSDPREQRWYNWDTLPVSIGQGYVNVTPMQMAQAMAVLSSSGYKRRPYLVKRYRDGLSGKYSEVPQSRGHQLEIPERAFSLVKSYAAIVVNGEHGTGKRAKLDGVIVGGKTGTAQYAALDKSKKDNDHAWFVAFAPVDNPMIAMAVLVENGGKGGVAAAPIAKQVMEVFFKKKGMLTPQVEGQTVGEVDEETPVDFDEEQDRIDADVEPENNPVTQ